MARLIDADALPIHKAYCVDEAGWGANFYVADKSDIDNAPTIDAVPVVRCKDCKFMTLADGGMRFCIVWHGMTGMGDDGFCSYGERKEGEE